jgi:hypothetical protein
MTKSPKPKESKIQRPKAPKKHECIYRFGESEACDYCTFTPCISEKSPWGP